MPGATGLPSLRRATRCPPGKAVLESARTYGESAEEGVSTPYRDPQRAGGGCKPVGRAVESTLEAAPSGRPMGCR
jgi:hypothetical protein